MNATTDEAGTTATPEPQTALDRAFAEDPDGGPSIGAHPTKDLADEPTTRKSLFDIPDTVEDGTEGQTPTEGNPDPVADPQTDGTGNAEETATAPAITYPIEYEYEDGKTFTIEDEEAHAALLKAGHNPAAMMTAAHKRNRDARLEAQEKTAYETRIKELEAQVATSAPDPFDSLPQKTTAADWNALASLNVVGSATYNPAEYQRKFAELEKRETDRDRALFQAARDAGKTATETPAAQTESPEAHKKSLMATAEEWETAHPLPEGKEGAFLEEFNRLATEEFGEAGAAAMSERDVKYLMREAYTSVTAVTDPVVANEAAAAVQKRALIRAVETAPKETPASNARPDQSGEITDPMVQLADNPVEWKKYSDQAKKDNKYPEFLAGRYVPDIT